MSHSASPKTWRSIGRGLLASAIVFGLCLTALGCDSGGTNGEDDDNGDNGPTPTAPAAPTGLEATSANSEIALDWETISEAESYNVYRSTSSTNGAEGEPEGGDISEASYTDEAVENGTTYYYRVTAVGSEGNESDASSEVKVTPFDEPPSRPN